LRPALLEPVRVWRLGDSRPAGRSALGEAMARLGPLGSLAPPRPLGLGPVLARALAAHGPELLVADCGALRTRVWSLGRGAAAVRVLQNERCTAGVGRFVETMGAALGVGLAHLDACAARAASPSRVSSPCTVFAESEVVSQVNAGLSREDVLAGVVAHAVEKVASLVGRAGPQGRPLLVCGGLARLAAFRTGLSAALPGVRLVEPPADPLLLQCLAGLALVTGRPADEWPRATPLPWEGRDAA
jgi:activator of 2-hydroxyglutaryl-CoA dehydratase